MEDIIYWIWLSILNFKPDEKIKLLKFFKRPKNLFYITEKELEKLTSSSKIIKEILDNKKRKIAESIFLKCQNQEIKLINCKSIQYSRNLKEIYDYPILIYAKGNVELLNTKSIAIVGCRNYSEYGREISRKFSYLLSKKDFTIVSGMAKGIDTFAHMGTLEARGKTIAVLGSGIDYIYPRENKQLYYNILKKEGLIISEFPPGTVPKPEYFPQRNRIISGLSSKVLVIEATKNSGSIITANIAAEQGREIYAVPGEITKSNSTGTNDLIKDGAILVSSLEDIINL